MQTRLYIRIGIEPEHKVSWLKATETESRVRFGTLMDASNDSAGCQVTILAPSMLITCVDVTLPSLRSARLRKVLPYAVEEQLATDVDALHLVTGVRGSDGYMPVLAVSYNQMLQWKTMFDAVSLYPEQMINEALALPMIEGEWTMLLGDDDALLRVSAYEGMALPPDQMQAWIDIGWDQRGDKVSGLTIYDARREGRDDVFLPPSDMQVTYIKCAEPLALLAENISTTSINLLTENFSPHAQKRRGWRIWRGASAIALIVIMLQFGIVINEHYRLKNQSDYLHQAIETTYREMFPDSGAVVNPRIQMERQLEELRTGGQSPFIHIMSLAVPVLTSINNLKMLNLGFRHDEFEMEFEIDSLADLEKVKNELEREELQVVIGTATSRNNRIDARLTVKGSRE